MSTLATFESSLSGLVDSCRRVEPAAFEETLADVVADPAVGAPLPFEAVTLEGTSVDTAFDADKLATSETGVTPAGLGIADYGTVTVRATAGGDELVALYPDRHVAVVHADDVVPDMETAFSRLGEEFDAGDRTQVLATGPSATADMGGLIQGVHGPKEVHVVVVEP